MRGYLLFSGKVLDYKTMTVPDFLNPPPKLDLTLAFLIGERQKEITLIENLLKLHRESQRPFHLCQHCWNCDSFSQFFQLLNCVRIVKHSMALSFRCGNRKTRFQMLPIRIRANGMGTSQFLFSSAWPVKSLRDTMNS